MDERQRERMLRFPQGRVSAVLDTDAFNEVDDQFALAYLWRHPEKICLEAVYAAPFLNEKVESPGEGMERSYEEIRKIFGLMGASEYGSVYRGATRFMERKAVPVVSEASEDLVRRALGHSAENPLYVIGIAAATNIASAILSAPEITERIVVIWLGGSAFHRDGEEEFNLMEDEWAARFLFSCGVPLVHVPCWGVAEYFTLSRAELEKHLAGKNPLADYLAAHTIEEADGYAQGLFWTKTIWDVTAAAWLLNDGGKFMKDELICGPVLEKGGRYRFLPGHYQIRTVTRIERDELATDLIRTLIR